MKTKLLFTIALLALSGLSANAQCTTTAGPNSTICYGRDSVMLSASSIPAAVSYSWVPSSGLSCTTCPNPWAKPFFTNTYTVYTTDANSCIASATVSITVGSIPFVSAIAPTTICTGDSAQLFANTSNGMQPYLYYWFPPNDLNNPNLQNPTAGPAFTTLYTVTVTDAFGCTDDTTTTVYVQTVPVVTWLPFSISGNTVTFMANASSNTQSCSWFFGDGTNFSMPVTGDTVSVSHTYNWGGNYTVCLTVWNPPCSDTICQTITISGINDYDLSSPIDIFPNPSTGKFTISSDPSTPLKVTSIEVYNVFGEMLVDLPVNQSTNQLINLSSQPSGIYFLHLKTENGIGAVKKVIVSR